MSAKEKQIASLLKSFAQGAGQYFYTAQVVSVESDTCTIKLDDVTIDKVRLKPTTDTTTDEIVMKPAPGSWVLLGSITGNINNLFVIQANSYQEVTVKIGNVSAVLNTSGIIFNEGENGGVINVAALTAWMQNVVNDITQIATGLAAIPFTFVPTTQAPNRTTLEDTQVKH